MVQNSKVVTAVNIFSEIYGLSVVSICGRTTAVCLTTTSSMFISRYQSIMGKNIEVCWTRMWTFYLEIFLSPSSNKFEYIQHRLHKVKTLERKPFASLSYIVILFICRRMLTTSSMVNYPWYLGYLWTYSSPFILSIIRSVRIAPPLGRRVSNNLIQRPMQSLIARRFMLGFTKKRNLGLLVGSLHKLVLSLRIQSRVCCATDSSEIIMGYSCQLWVSQ